jgi:GAF domain-containing protein/anti-sigma regulatory factor (Ser/Thr protein kinase)
VPIESVLRVGTDRLAAAEARRFVAQALREWQRDGLTDLRAGAQLAVTELVTNAQLHARPPIVVRVRLLTDGVRLEVADGSHSMPIAPTGGTATGMTGRGMGIVRSVARRWGVDPAPDGKVVWCELGGGSPDDRTVGWEIDLERLPTWEEPTGAEPRCTVRLSDVPTDLLLDAKAHVDNVVRELTLAAAAPASSASAAVPRSLAQLLQRAVEQFAEARQSIKRQAVAAAGRGDPRTTLTLTLPVSAAAAGEAYLQALDQVDTYARAARMLTLETPPQHRVFRQWYVGSLVEQLRAAAAGAPVRESQTFEQRLLLELEAVATAQRATDRAARLQAVTAALAATASLEDVATVVVSHGVQALGASGGTLLVPSHDGHLVVPAAVGYADKLIDQLRAEQLDAELPAAVALRTRQPVWLESRHERNRRFPELGGMEPGAQSMCAVPLVISGRALGVLRFSFDAPRLFDDDERVFALALAAQTAQAVERSRLYEAERDARRSAESVARRLAGLQRVTAKLAAARDVESVATIIVTDLADVLEVPLASLSMLDDADTLRLVRLRGGRPETRERWATYPVAAALPSSEAVRTRAPVVVRDRAELERRYPALAGQAVHDRALVCLPLAVGPRVLGVVSLSFPLDHNVEDPQELAFLTTLGETCAQALERAAALASAKSVTEKLSLLSEASAALVGSLDHESTLRELIRLLVPRLADWCAVHVLGGGGLGRLEVAHAWPDADALLRAAEARFPVDPGADSGIAHVVRTGVAELYPEIREPELSSALIVPLTGLAGPFGAITLVYAGSGRRYGEQDRLLAEELAARAAVAVENARAYEQKTGQLAVMTRVAEAAQQAILAPMPSRLGPLRLAAAYQSAATEALIGGDLYEILRVPNAARMIIGDVRGKGLDAIRLATIVLGHFRSAAADCPGLRDVARRMDSRLRPYLGDEDFVTALLVEVADDGFAQVAACGHPPALLAYAGRIDAVGRADSLPLGLGADPEPVLVSLPRGARLLLHTDGLAEARRTDGRFVDLSRLVEPLATGPLKTVLDRVLDRLFAEVGASTGDDLALVAVEYAGEDEGDRRPVVCTSAGQPSRARRRGGRS